MEIEKIESKIFIIEDLFKKKVNLPYLNKSVRRHYKHYYNTNTKKIVENLFRKDLETFGYNF